MTNSIREGGRRIGSVQIAATLEARIAAAALPVFDSVAAEDVLPKVLTRSRDCYFSGFHSFRIMAWPTGSEALSSSRLVGW